jgi:hypothetical protein
MFNERFQFPSVAACAALAQHRSTQRKIPQGRDDEARLTADIVELARQYGRYGYRKIAELLCHAGWLVNDKRVERIWRREGLKVPARQPKRARLWLSDGSCLLGLLCSIIGVLPLTYFALPPEISGTPHLIRNPGWLVC